jgi:hypothetical protein
MRKQDEKSAADNNNSDFAKFKMTVCIWKRQYTIQIGDTL